MILTQKLKDWLVKNCDTPAQSDDAVYELAAALAVKQGTLSPAELAELTTEGPDPRKLFTRVKDASERYSTSKAAAVHPKTGKPVVDHHGRPVYLPSEKECAMAGAWLKRAALRGGISGELNEHERELLDESFAKDTFCGVLNGEDVADIPGARVKALLDDTTSGGIEVAPTWFDRNIIQFPLLYGELYPLVDVVEVVGRRIETASVGNPTVTWGTAEGSTLTAFTTDALIAEITGTVYPVAVHVEMGRDFMADAAVDIGRILVENIGQRVAEELDDVVANGNGTTQPQGIFVASGVTDVGNPAGGAGAAAQVDDYLTLLFGIDKQYRNRAWNPCFIANDTSYQRARSIAVGAADERLVFGMDVGSYEMFGWPYRIQNDISNARQAFGCMKKYRMWRRAGMAVEWTDQGSTLRQKNLALLTVRGRFGGKIVDANAFCKQTNAQA